jgi:Phosphoglycerate kinase
VPHQSGRLDAYSIARTSPQRLTGYVPWLALQGRPKDGPEDKFRLTPVVPRLSELLGTNVEKVDDCIGPKVEEAVGKLQNGQVGRRTTPWHCPPGEQRTVATPHTAVHSPCSRLAVALCGHWPALGACA